MRDIIGHICCNLYQSGSIFFYIDYVKRLDEILAQKIEKFARLRGKQIMTLNFVLVW